MLVLGIETSCDETGLALYDSGRGLLAHALHSQVAMHEAYGGVVPELASRDHIRRVVPLAESVLREARRSLADLDGVAYTEGPGLAGALLVGASVANGLGFALGIPVLGVHHLEGHLLSPLLAEPRSAITPCSAIRMTMQPAKPSTRRRSCSACPIRAARRCPGWPSAAGAACSHCRVR